MLLLNNWIVYAISATSKVNFIFWDVESWIAIPNLLLQFIVVDIMWVSMIEDITVMDSIRCDWYADSNWRRWLVVWWFRASRTTCTVCDRRWLVFFVRWLRNGHVQSSICIEWINSGNAIFTVLSETEHVSNATQNARLLCTLILALIQRTLEWSVTTYEAIVGLSRRRISFQKPMLSRSCNKFKRSN